MGIPKNGTVDLLAASSGCSVRSQGRLELSGRANVQNMTIGDYDFAFKSCDDRRYHVYDDDEIYGVDISPSIRFVDEDDVTTDINKYCTAWK